MRYLRSLICVQDGHSARSVLILGTALVLLSSANRSHGGTFEAANRGEVREIRSDLRAAQFLSKATFGPTQEMIDTLSDRIRQVGYRRACGEWIDNQFSLQASSHEQVARDMVAADGRTITESGVGIANYRYQAWWHIALTREDQLRQKVAWALSQIFVISDSGTGFNNNSSRNIGNDELSIPDWLGMSNYYDMLADHADGNYRDILGDVTFHECMGVYLSSYRNRKADLSKGRWPDENYAREIMQLFSIGLYELRQDGRLKVNDQGELIPTYDNGGITELARLFTGFKSKHNTSTSFYAGRNYGAAMQMHYQEHDNNKGYSDVVGEPGYGNNVGSKTLFGTTLSALPDPLTAEAALAEVNEGLDVIAAHENVPPFICRLLIQRMVKSNPSRGYTRRVTRKFRDNGQGVRGDMKAVIKAILLDPEAVRGQRALRKREPLRVEVVTRGTEHSRLREPIQRVTSLIRALRPSSDYPKSDSTTNEPYMALVGGLRDDLGQMPFRAPSVFNYYLPDYQPPGDLIGYRPSQRIPREGLFAPEFQVLTAVTSNRTMNRFSYWTRNRFVRYTMRDNTQLTISFDLTPELDLAKNNANLPEILRRFDLLLCHGSLSEETKASIISGITSESTAENENEIRLEVALLAVLLSPDCAIEE
ncbi:DUF1800 domain-containing protein [Rubripirellula sp.]|nr:DUF1800 family protein [Rubripirellula sp.]MDB4749456.1 DUF1800 domain-containing protein [Rubripirellula sp.]